MEILLSIIIPCFNNENYIEECINSVLKQIDKNAEIIIINDGSTDNSEKIIKNCIGINSTKNIRYFKQENSGAGHARNQGIIHANGIYISFLDSDDIWLENTWNTLKPILQEEKNDLIEFDAYRFDEKSNITESDKFFQAYLLKNKTLSQDEKLKFVFSESKWQSCLRIYHNKIIQNARFLTSCRLSEDITFTVQAYLNCKNILSLNIPLIGYRFNSKSITNTPKESNLQDLKKVIENLLNLSSNEKEISKKYLIHLTCVRIWVSLRSYNFHYKNKITSNFLNKIKIKLNQYNYKNELSKKFLILYKYDTVALLYFHLKQR